MMAQTPKPIEEVLEYLEGKKKIVIMGCGVCATIFHTGSPAAVEEMSEKLTKEGKEITAKIAPPFAFPACYLPVSSMFLKENQKAFEECDAVLMMSCSDGAQAVRGYLEDEMGLVKQVYSANDALGYSSGGPTDFIEECQGCGECELNKTAAICPLTQCSKGLMNGPCGGVRKDGKCEVDPDKDCAWVQIYKRFEKFGELDKLLEIREPHDWSKTARPRKLLGVEPLDLMEELRGTKKAMEGLGV
ncbi:MAG: methylenetetrahydrofolate reductase C-terminal domain-containing protein [Euryarchaeota archaeon]|nr:methylenetetrahydrofolate reductase C-terminal domain-containing protein [Euryarchaeota archaeon]